MRILLCNDDGVFADGLQRLLAALQPIADVVIVAPDRNRSGASNSLTLDNPIRVRQLQNNIYSVEGTPTDCVHLAMTGLLNRLPDIVISGVNDRANLGDDIWYSGTVAAAMEGAIMYLPAIAISLDLQQGNHFDTAIKVVPSLLSMFEKVGIKKNTMLNVNVPDVPYDDLQGIAITRLGSRHRAEPMIKAKDPRGKIAYWVGAAGAEQDASEGTDFFAIANKQVSITPINVDLTDYQSVDVLREWVHEVV